jgi:acid phosphatase
MLNAVLWQQRAPEYRAAALQAYTLAQIRLEEGLSAGWSAALEQVSGGAGLPPAVLLDVDETVIDNSDYEARIVRRLGRYDRDSFARWCAEDAAGAVPGALEFVRAARARGVTVIFYTAREERLRECTQAALERLGFGPVAPGELYLRGAGSKHALRERLAQRYRLVLLIGDSLEDFVAGSRSGADVRDAVARRHAERFGRQWIVLPNPVYGHWEALWYDFDYEAPRAEMIERKRGALLP